MLLTIQRQYKQKATPGRLFINGTYFCYTLELPKGKCIPEGEYGLHLTFSPRFQRIMPQIMRVPGFEGIRVHWGNFIKDTQGCPLVAYDRGFAPDGTDAIFRSKMCFEELNNWLTEANKGQVLAIEIKEDKSGF